MKFSSVLFAALFIATAASAQSTSGVFLKQLGRYAAAIGTAADADGSDYEALEKANTMLHDWLVREGAKHPEWLQAGAPVFDSSDIHVITSVDRRFRIYSWDRRDGGTMHFYSGVIQYLSAPGRALTVSLLDTMSMEDGGGPGERYFELHTVKTKSGKTFYLALHVSRYSSRDLGSGIRAYTIVDGRLRDDVPLFFTPKKSHADISYSYDYFKYAGKEKGPPQLTYREKERELLVPVVRQDDTITDRALVYRFNGERFVYAPTK